MVEEFFKDIIAEMETKPKLYLGVGSNIVDELNKLASLQANRFPMIAVIRPFKVIEKADMNEITISRVVIADKTDPTKAESKRIDDVYVKTLRPIEQEFKSLLSKSKLTYTKIGGIEYTKEETPYINTERTTDKIDGIIINNLVLKIKKSNCNGL